MCKTIANHRIYCVLISFFVSKEFTSLIIRRDVLSELMSKGCRNVNEGCFENKLRKVCSKYIQTVNRNICCARTRSETFQVIKAWTPLAYLSNFCTCSNCNFRGSNSCGEQVTQRNSTAAFLFTNGVLKFSLSTRNK